ncbi:MAG: galactose mutarotase [Clostridia bacterium]|nr:galactose mutarotase [Clostridia bacterium]
MKKEVFGKVNGQEVYLFTMENKNNLKLVVSNYGALIINIDVPDKNGKIADVALGYDTLEEYIAGGSFYGAIIGPNANRIDYAKYTLNGVTYTLDVNDKTNNLHSHREIGVHKRIWDYKEEENSVTFTLKLADGDMGFGGNKTFVVKYSLTDDNELVIDYDGTSDIDTVINLTNHCYFNLDGHDGETIRKHKLTLLASAYTPIDAKFIPTGDILRVEGTPFDFTTEHEIGERIDESYEQLTLAGGYDHNWVCDGYTGLVRKVAILKNTDETRTMEVYTDLPGIQFYAGNMMDGEIGKGGASYKKNGAVALETQFYPDSVNKPHFPSAIFGPERPFKSTTIYKFI